MHDLTSSMRAHLEDTVETPDTTNLHLSKEEFMTRMLKEKDGWALLNLLEMGESNIVERMGLCHGSIGEDGSVWFDVPGWKSLVAHLRIVNSV